MSHEANVAGTGGDPYRDDPAYLRQQALLAEERELLVRAGRAMVIAGVLGVIGTLLGVYPAFADETSEIGLVFSLGLPALFAALTLQAGLVLRRLPGGSQDYAAIERAVASLGLLFKIKGVIVLILMALMTAAMILPLLIRIFT